MRLSMCITPTYLSRMTIYSYGRDSSRQQRRHFVSCSSLDRKSTPSSSPPPNPGLTTSRASAKSLMNRAQPPTPTPGPAPALALDAPSPAPT